MNQVSLTNTMESLRSLGADGATLVNVPLTTQHSLSLGAPLVAPDLSHIHQDPLASLTNGTPAAMNSTVGPLGNSNPVGALVNSSPAVPLINSTPAVNNNPRVPLETVSKPEIKPEPLSTSPEPLDEDALDPTSLLRQINQLGPSERCSPIQAGSMGKKLLTIIAYHEQNNLSLPEELQSSFDILHRCLAVVYGTFFLNLYTKANAPCLLCHSCKCLYPPGQFIHHSCASLPVNIVPCRSRMWRRCLVPLVSPGVDKDEQKQRWKFVLEKFSHNAATASRKNPIPPETEAQLLDIPELKKRRFNKSRKEGDEEVLVKADGGSGLNVLEMTLEGHDDSLDASSPVDGSNSLSYSTPLVLAEQLVLEVKRLQKELTMTKGKVQTLNDIIGKMPSEACMREQLSQALINKQSLTLERDQAREQARLATERADKLQKQLDLLRHTHAQMEKQFSF